MAKARKPVPKLTLDLEGPRITSDQFRRAVDAFFAMVDEVSRQMTGGARVRWLVSVKGGSVHLSAAPEATRPEVQKQVLRIVRAVRTGISLVSRRAERPEFFSDVALRYARELASIPEARQIETAQISLANQAAKLTAKTVANINELLGSHIKDYGTVEGKLLVLSAAQGASIAVVDPLTERMVRCSVSETQLDAALHAFRKRVAVSGLIHYRKDGQPNNIEVDDLFVFPDRSDLPTAEEVHGILSKTE